MRVLVTRPLEDAERTAQALRAAGHEPLVAPIFKIRPLSHAVPSRLNALIATSANALRQAALSAVEKTTPVFTVGDATANEARLSGFSNVISAGGDSNDLVALVGSRLLPGDHLGWLAGLHRRDDAIAGLQSKFSVQVIETYENVAVALLPDTVAVPLRTQELDAVLHFSRRSAETFAALIQEASMMAEANSLLHVYISPAAATAPFPRHRIAHSPDLFAMVAAIAPD